MDQETTTISIKELTELLDIRREYFKVCDRFSIPPSLRGQHWVGDGINERINTYLTSYTIKKTMAERETGAAFRNTDEKMKADNIQDPI